MGICKTGFPGRGAAQTETSNIYFAGRLMRTKDHTTGNETALVTDRVGSVAVRVNPSGINEKLRYYPYGEEYTATTNDRDKFATYSRDSSTGLDYAMNRYYGSNLGRFLTPDPYGGSGKFTDPQTWNRYSYVGNDPTNRSDPTGLDGPGFWTAEGIKCVGAPVWRVGWGWETWLDPIDIAIASGPGGGGAVRDPQTVARPIAQLEAGLVKAGKSDCEGLASFAKTLAKATDNTSDFVEGFGVFINNRDASVVRANELGISISGNSDPVHMLRAGEGVSGFLPDYQESLDPVNIDQTHHFAAFFQFGYRADAVSSTAAAVLRDIYPFNQGDINLGVRAGLIGSFLKNGTISKDDVGSYISDLCKH